MRPALPYNSLHNPFHNRFNYPVTCRRDEMQAYAYKVWLRERNQGGCQGQGNSTAAPSSVDVAERRANSSNALEPTPGEQIFVGGFALFLILFVLAVVLLKTL